MLFNSINFVVFLALVLAIARAGGLRLRNWILLVSSIIFYALGSWFYYPPTLDAATSPAHL